MVFKYELMLSTVLLLISASSSLISYKSNNHDWDHLLFAQQWPEAVCEEANDQGKYKCEIPSMTKTWTVHGLWPNLGSTTGPKFCNKSWKFDVSKIESILPKLDIAWPNLYKDRGRTFLWKHEWERHGTCAASLDSLRGEMKYFSTGLSLNKKYDVLGALSKRGISPRPQQYRTEDVIKALQEEFGRRICITCFKNTKAQMVLKEARICLNKSLDIIDCPNNCNKKCLAVEKLDYHQIASTASGFVHDVFLISLLSMFTVQVFVLN